MRIQELRQIYRAEPFRPFVLHLADGRHVRVAHPELMALSQTGRTVFVYGKDDSFEVIDLLLVTSVKVSNGRAKSRKKK